MHLSIHSPIPVRTQIHSHHPTRLSGLCHVPTLPIRWGYATRHASSYSVSLFPALGSQNFVGGRRGIAHHLINATR